MKKINYNLISKYRSTLMGASIISIILFHFVYDVSTHKTHYYYFLKIYKLIIGSSGVDIFLLLSGLGLYYSFKKNSNKKIFYKKRFSKILISYFIICLPSILCRNMFSGKSILTVIKDFTFITFFTDSNRWFWYILLIMFCYIIFPYFYEVFDEKQSEKSEQMRMLSIFTFFIMVSLVLFNCNRLAFDRLNIMLLRIPVFIFGIYLGKQSYNNRKLKVSSYLFFIVMSILCLFLLKPYNVIISRIVLAFFAISYFSLFIIFIDKFEENILIKTLNKILNKIGEYTLELYLVHVAFRRFFIHFKLYTYKIEYELLMILISIVISIIVHKISIFIEKRIIKG